MSTTQTEHFKMSEHRYDEQLLMHPPVHVADETERIISLLKKNNVKSVVDFGCGNGRLSIPLLQAGFHVAAVDISEESLGRLVSVAKKLHCDSHLTVGEGVPGGQFDAVVGSDILHHVSIGEEMKKMRGALREGGIIVFSEPNFFNISWILFITLFLDWRVEKGIVYCNHFSLRSILKGLAFEKIRFDGFAFIPPPFLNGLSLLRKLNYYVGSLPLLRIFAYRIILSAVKRS